MPRPLIVPVAGRQYRIQDSPDSLEGEADYQLDHIDCVIWLAPALGGRRRERAIARAVSDAWASGAGLIPVVQ